MTQNSLNLQSVSQAATDCLTQLTTHLLEFMWLPQQQLKIPNRVCVCALPDAFHRYLHRPSAA